LCKHITLCVMFVYPFFFFFSSRRRHTRSVSAFLLNRSSDLLSKYNVDDASSAPVLQTPKATSSTLYFDSLTVNAGNGGFLHCIRSEERRVGKECRSRWWRYD